MLSCKFVNLEITKHFEGISSIENTAVIGECKFKNEKIDKGIYETLILKQVRSFYF